MSTYNKLDLVGGKGTSSWDDLPEVQSYGDLTGLLIQCGEAIDAIQGVYGSNKGQLQGGTGGNKINVTFDGPVVAMSGLTGLYGGVPQLIQVSFKTLSGKVYGPYGAATNAKELKPFEVQAPSGQRINALNGTVAKHADGRSYISGLGATLTPPPKQGKAFVNGDEWPLSDPGFNAAPDARIFAQNLAKWFSGGKPGKFLVRSSNFGLTGQSFQEALKAAGHTVTVDVNAPLTVEALRAYDAVFLAGDPADNNALIEYVKSGGGVYVAAGTGNGGPVSEAGLWNTFLNAFGLKLEPSYVDPNVTIDIPPNAHPVLTGVSKLFINSRQPITDINPESPANKVIFEVGGSGLLASYDASLVAAV